MAELELIISLKRLMLSMWSICSAIAKLEKRIMHSPPMYLMDIRLLKH